jgi:hypothetical protein
LVGLIALVLSLGYPFRHFPHILEWLGPIKQFRSVARLSWICYFAFSLIAFIQLYSLANWLRVRGKGLLAMLLWSIPVLVLLLEGFTYSREIKELAEIQGGDYESFLGSAESSSQPGRNGLELVAYRTSYQAILPLPYFHVGSDSDFRLMGSDKILRESFFLSLKTSLPLLAVHLSRTSLRHTRWSLSIFGEDPRVQAEFRSYFPGKKDFLILWTGEELKPAELRLLNRSVLVGHYRDGSLHRLSFDQLFSLGPQAD